MSAQTDGSADDARIAPELPLEQTVGKHQRVALSIPEQVAEGGPSAGEIPEIAGHFRDHVRLGAGFRRERFRPGTVRHHLFK